MAGRKKAAEEVASTTPEIGKTKLQKLLAAARVTYRESRKLAGTLGEQIKDAVENEHLHKKAFSFVRSADRMEPAELADYLDHIELYLDMTGLKERAESAPRLPIQSAEDSEGEGSEAVH